MNESYCVQITKDYLVFSAAHFITFAGNHCERLHGHNYRVAAEIDGPLDENHYLVDFVALTKMLKEILDGLDHRVLLPTNHPNIAVRHDHDQIEARFEGRRWVFPRSDCVIRPIPTPTSELLARHIAHRLLEELKSRCGLRPSQIRIEVSEGRGQMAAFQGTC